MRFAVIALLAVLAQALPHSLLAAEDRSQFYVIQFSKGPDWIDGIRYEKQPRLGDHLDYWTELYYKEILLMNGPWRDESGGIFIIRSNSRKNVDAILEGDPGIKANIIKATVNEWRVLNSAMRSVKPVQIEIAPDETFKLKRLDPASSINLPND